jgi:hypothetical protein
MLIDDSASASGCLDAATVDSIRINAGGPGGADPELTVSLSREPAEHRIYVRSANLCERDAVALFAVIWRNAQNGKSPAHKIARRD